MKKLMAYVLMASCLGPLVSWADIADIDMIWYIIQLPGGEEGNFECTFLKAGARDSKQPYVTENTQNLLLTSTGSFYRYDNTSQANEIHWCRSWRDGNHWWNSLSPKEHHVDYSEWDVSWGLACKIGCDDFMRLRPGAMPVQIRGIESVY